MYNQVGVKGCFFNVSFRCVGRK